MGTSCVTRLVDHVLSSYDAECIPLYLINEYWWTFYQMWTYLDNGWDNRLPLIELILYKGEILCHKDYITDT